MQYRKINQKVPKTKVGQEIRNTFFLFLYQQISKLNITHFHGNTGVLASGV